LTSKEIQVIVEQAIKDFTLMDFDYKKYSLENLEKWMSDALVLLRSNPTRNL
jgi:hypothetical protein